MIFLDWLCGDVPERSVPLGECLISLLVIIIILLLLIGVIYIVYTLWKSNERMFKKKGGPK